MVLELESLIPYGLRAAALAEMRQVFGVRWRVSDFVCLNREPPLICKLPKAELRCMAVQSCVLEVYKTKKNDSCDPPPNPPTTTGILSVRVFALGGGG